MSNEGMDISDDAGPSHIRTENSIKELSADYDSFFDTVPLGDGEQNYTPDFKGELPHMTSSKDVKPFNKNLEVLNEKLSTMVSKIICCLLSFIFIYLLSFVICRLLFIAKFFNFHLVKT